MEKRYKVGIIGGTSLLAGLIIKYLSRHRYVETAYIDSEHSTGKRAGEVHKYLKGEIADYIFDKPDMEFVKNELDLVFVAKPHRESMNFVSKVYNDKLKIIDLSGDFRISEKSVYEKWYKAEHTVPELIEKAVYGLSEIYTEEIKRSKLIANPGCYPTGILLGLYPALKNNLADNNIIYIDSYSGVSGAGNKPVPGKNLFTDAFNNVIAYRITDHQHTPEIEEQLSKFYKDKVFVNFVPHIASMENGIFSTIFISLKNKYSGDEIKELYKEAYKDKYFVKICEEAPQIKDVVDTNFTYISIAKNERTNTLIILSVIDNRIKGGAGQAVQNMNLMLGYNEFEGLI